MSPVVKSCETNSRGQPSLANTLTRSVVFALMVICVHVAHAQDRISIIPQPRQVTANGEKFQLDRAHIVLADPCSAEDRFAGTDFGQEFSLRVTGGRDRKAILIGHIELPAIQKALKAAKLDVPANLNEEGYVFHATANGVIVAGGSAAGTFYGLQTLKQLVRGEGRTAFIQGVH